MRNPWSVCFIKQKLKTAEDHIRWGVVCSFHSSACTKNVNIHIQALWICCSNPVHSEFEGTQWCIVHILYVQSICFYTKQLLSESWVFISMLVRVSSVSHQLHSLTSESWHILTQTNATKQQFMSTELSFKTSSLHSNWTFCQLSWKTSLALPPCGETLHCKDSWTRCCWELL